MGSIAQQLVQQFTTLMTTILVTVDSSVVGLARLAHVSVLQASISLYFTRTEESLERT
jgi:hypothetical protein